MKKGLETTIVEFEVIAPTDATEKVGDKLSLSDFGDYYPEDFAKTQYGGRNLLFLLDHTLHYRVSKIMMKGKVYIIPADRKKNYITDMHPSSLKFRKIPNRYNVLHPSSTAALVKSESGHLVEFNDVKHLF